ncbi:MULTISPECIES: MarR family winged helix-turn-helix transcriptional regulator [Bacillus]|jgi:DNA-binding MarR family transcriptional regulator|uniref:Transcriptional regulator (MarR family) n=6 Tax=Bacillus amyloliquefaciens group TaxID=1938374 RepID=A0A9P1JKB2_BACAS|nr:MarR family transcriptional regulator [Bacillus amyloliquefaciens]AIW35474.1 MarR family transcriptional regulator [Bacillus subtilis]AEB25843.1 transcriptional regulator (MarR family) protein [Bacillus amyloliquefaciens TA208]AEB65316.1 putative transcriptional regulator (MarR family) [Bacillus amyloliquefaciens LL3]AEK90889.1 putative transcriptional regulator [Bacillus amyloliquefaciens XH7]ARW40841.1 putative HTH-type transcriptional regulator YwoH [Bacillus amyloliquefaciens]
MIHVNRRLIHQINQCARLITKKANERLEPFGLYSSQWSILYCLKTIGPMTQKEIWSYLNVEAPTVTRTIKRLEENGWIQREQGEDKREKLVVLTKEAELKYDSINQEMLKFEEDMLADFQDGDKEAFSEFLNVFLTKS